MRTEVCPECGGAGRVDTPETIGERIRHTRKRLGLSLRELARRVGISAAFLSDIEHGRRGMSGATEAAVMENLRGPI